jgi:hypothetical protein
MLRRYKSHWSDNRNQLGEPSVVRLKNEQFPEPWVYCFAESLKKAKQRVTEFNSWLRPTLTPQPAHCPTKALARRGFLTFPASPLRSIDPDYLNCPYDIDIFEGGPKPGFVTIP